MTRDNDPQHKRHRPARTAAEQALTEFEEAETDPRHEQEKDPQRGEGAGAITPAPAAQEDARGE